MSAKDLLKEGQDIGFKVNAGVSSNKGWSKGATVYSRAQAMDVLLSGNWVKESDYKAGNGYKIKNSALGQRGLLAKVGVDFEEDHRIELKSSPRTPTMVFVHYARSSISRKITMTPITPLAIASPQTTPAKLNGQAKTWALSAMLRLMYGVV